MAQLVKRPPLDFGSGHYLTVHGIKPHIGLCADSEEPAWDSLSLSLPLPCSHTGMRAHFAKINTPLKKERWGAWVAQSVKRPTSARSRSRGPGVRAPRQALG